MKKLTAMFVVLALILGMTGAVFAEEAEIPELNWEALEEDLAESGIEGDFYRLGGVNVIMWIPDFMPLYEAESSETIAYFENDEETFCVYVNLNESDMDYEDGLAYLQDADMEDISELRINGLKTILYNYILDDTAHLGLVMFSASGYTLEFTFRIIDEEYIDSVLPYILASIQLDA